MTHHTPYSGHSYLCRIGRVVYIMHYILQIRAHKQLMCKSTVIHVNFFTHFLVFLQIKNSVFCTDFSFCNFIFTQASCMSEFFYSTLCVGSAIKFCCTGKEFIISPTSCFLKRRVGLLFRLFFREEYL